MKCRNCGKELEAGSIYCPKCGREVQIVSDSSILEDELLEVLLDEQSKAEKLQQEIDRKEQEKQERMRRKKSEETRRKKQKKKKIILLIIIIICAAVAVSALLYIKKINSFSYIYDQAELAYNIGQYEEAESKLQKALDKNPDSEEACLLLGKVYTELGENEKAEDCLKNVIQLNPDSEDAYKALLNMYASGEDFDSITALRDTVPSSKEEILKLFNQYLTDMPAASLESGSYNEAVEVELSASKELEIYYTLDGSDPTDDGILYEDPIQISEEGKTILKAVCKSRNNVYSDILEMRYDLEFEAPDMPSASPDGGQFTQASQVTLSAGSGTTIYYTWDGSRPNESSQKYTGPIDIPEGNNILSAIAVDNRTGEKSAVLKSNFIYYPE